MLDNLCDQTVVLGPSDGMSVAFSIPVLVQQTLKLFVDSVEKVVVHTATYVFIR